MKRHNGFNRRDGATFLCESCGRRTRHTGVQALGSDSVPSVGISRGSRMKSATAIARWTRPVPRWIGCLQRFAPRVGMPAKAFMF